MKSNELVKPIFATFGSAATLLSTLASIESMVAITVGLVTLSYWALLLYQKIKEIRHNRRQQRRKEEQEYKYVRSEDR